MSVTQFTPSIAALGSPAGEPGLLYDPVLRLGISWLESPVEAERAQPNTMALAEAVAGIVGIAATRARNAGDLAALRNAVERALAEAPVLAEASDDPREARASTPRQAAR